MTLGEWLAAIGIIIAAGGAILAGAAWGRGSVMRATNEMLEKALGQERAERRENERRCQAQLEDLRSQIARLRR